MFGYMGFGMESWIYKRNPRDPFAKRDRMQSFSALPNYNQEFELKYHKIENKRHYGLLTILVVIGLSIMAGFSCYKFNRYTTKHTKLVDERLCIENREAFDFLLNSGYSRLKRGDVVGAYSEFVLAYKIDNHDEKLNALIIETLSILCDREAEYCSKLDIFMRHF